MRGSVDEADAQRVKVGQNLTVTIPYGRHPLKAKVEYIAAQVDPETQRVLFRTSIPNPGNQFKPGMFARQSRPTYHSRNRRATSAAGTAVYGADTRQAERTGAKG